MPVLEVGLCMSVKDEAENIVACLEPIADLFAKIMVIDTGSTDGTPELLREHFGIEVQHMELSEDCCRALSIVRNRGFDMLATPWFMTLDADERIERDQLAAVIALADEDLPAGLFCGWDTDHGDGALIDDYKLCFFRGAYRHMGLVHDTAQPSIRLAGGSAEWTDLLRIRHYPPPSRQPTKEVVYAARLACGKRNEPDWLRYDWFSGYQKYRLGQLDESVETLTPIHMQRPALFPVESLNASMVLASIAAIRGDRAAVATILADANAYLNQVRDDFEVRINFRLGDWLRNASAQAVSGALDAIRPYAFAY